MKSLLILISFLTFLNLSSNSSEFEKAKDTIELRQSVMQGIWARVKRLAPYIEVNNSLEYNEQLARQDAEDIKLLLEPRASLAIRMPLSLARDRAAVILTSLIKGLAVVSSTPLASMKHFETTCSICSLLVAIQSLIPTLKPKIRSHSHATN